MSIIVAITAVMAAILSGGATGAGCAVAQKGSGVRMQGEMYSRGEDSPMDSDEDGGGDDDDPGGKKFG
ncbi:uncharacterized protein N7483_011254 [Penicillium malachiteum]|uniref:uncharacterized protein n=1 Tax=Penicillium malachiteum TaxID=1324776 RepID=UPI002546E8B4|nr:uncharacterized protein N7483_011254 [Penicillium malachiteum]KAJ5714073.1 hypothetical protein N7483_011254 [Penicillium malachiteum]